MERWSSGETLNTQHQPGEAVVTNTHDQSGEAEATILMIYLLIYLLRWSFKVKDIVGCTHLRVERLEAQLEVELNTPGMIRLWRTLGAML